MCFDKIILQQFTFFIDFLLVTVRKNFIFKTNANFKYFKEIVQINFYGL